MNTKRLRRRLRAAGFELEVDGSDLVVRPAGNVTDWIAELISSRKSALVDLLDEGPSFEEHPPCVDCSIRLPLGGVRCPACRDAHSELACASCGVVAPGPDLSICDLCELEAARLARLEDAGGERE